MFSDEVFVFRQPINSNPFLADCRFTYTFQIEATRELLT